MDFRQVARVNEQQPDRTTPIGNSRKMNASRPSSVPLPIFIVTRRILSSIIAEPFYRIARASLESELSVCQFLISTVR